MLLAALPDWWLLSGKLHPVVVHFPIALLMVAAAMEFFRLRRGEHRPGHAALVCLALGAPSAVLAAVMGWSDAVTSGHTGSDAWVLDWHRWLGIATAGIAVLATMVAIASLAVAGKRTFAWYRFALVLSAALVAITGHFGGSLIYGMQYFPESWAKARGPAAPANSSLETVALKAPIDFTRDVQPIFARRCYQCHAGEKVESDLHLDSRAGALKGGKSGNPAIIPGKPAASELIKLIKGHDPKRAMPPKNGSLESQQIATLEAWIAQGVKWSAAAPGESWHWAYRPPVRLNPPHVTDSYWPRNPIDNFILAKLESDGLTPSPEADKATLLRRVSLDLTGLPPTPQELAAFEADTSAQAYERAVDRLLASPHYGERMAMKWLDLARYADTHGYEKDARRTMWPYRDWVIDAFNRDLPFDQFTIEQIAGDMLPSPSVEQIVATGFNRNTQINEEGGIDAEEFRADAVIDRTNTVGTVWLGTTIGCAQCHNHKNDPISQEEYYRFFAYFNNDAPDVAQIRPSEVAAAGGMIPISTLEHRPEFSRLQREREALQQKLDQADPAALASEQDAWEHTLADAAWTPVRITSASATGGTTLRTLEDGSILAEGKAPDTDTYTVELDSDLPRLTGLSLELLPDDTSKVIGRTPHGNIVLNTLRITSGPKFTEPVILSQALADHEQGRSDGKSKRWAIADVLDGDPGTGWAIKPQDHQPHTAIFRLARPIESAIHLRIVMEQNFGTQHTIARFRLRATADPEPQAAKPVSQSITAILAAPDRTPEQRDQLAAYFRSVAPSLSATRDRLGEIRARQAQLMVANAMVMKRAESPRETHIFERGSFLAPGKLVEPGLPAALRAAPAQQPAQSPPQNRLELARWLFATDNPLTARVAINRLWEQHFGRGLVETSEDFGTQGDYPTHPELLDYLATEFPRQGWSMKAMHRLIVTSATYRQSSNISKDLLERDPSNKLLARGPRFRVDAETVRDIALTASGLLSEKLGGPSVFPPQPSGIWTMIYNSDTWVESTGEDRYRRGLYTFSRRTSPYPAFTTFDSTSREVICTRRARTNTPLQALTTLNDPQYIEAAIGVAARMLREGGPTDANRIAYGFTLCTSRRPTEAESARLLALINQERETYTRDPDAAKKLLASAPGVNRDGLNDPDLAAWTLAANVLLNLDEAITRQ